MKIQQSRLTTELQTKGEMLANKEKTLEDKAAEYMVTKMENKRKLLEDREKKFELRKNEIGAKLENKDT